MLDIPYTLPSETELRAVIARLPAAPPSVLPTVVPAGCHPDLAAARHGKENLIDDVSLLLDRDQPLLREFKQRMRGVFDADPVVGARSHATYFMTKAQQYGRACAIMAAILRIFTAYQIPRSLQIVGWQVTGEMVPLFLHLSMFIPTIEMLGSDEQKRVWLPEARSLAMIGCYAQTEMGHGSNVQGIETIATLDESRDEFVLSTPTPTSAKCWPGGLAHTANTGLVMARIVVRGTDHGVHPVLVPLRDRATHVPCAGVRLLDLGPKIGFNVMDNGIMYLDAVRVPRTNLLAKSLAVARNGTVTTAAAPAVMYRTMLQMRAGIVVGAAGSLWRGATIVARYSTVRRQFSASMENTGKTTDQEEVAILDHQAQQYKVTVPVAAAFAFAAAGKALESTVRGAANTPGELRAAHMSSSALKVVTTHAACAMLETLRRACGGHGYAKSGGLADLSTAYVQMVTVEGDNTVLEQQVARALAKPGTHGLFDEARAAVKFGNVVDWTDASTVAQVLESRALALAHLYRAAPTGSQLLASHLVSAVGWARVFRAWATEINQLPASRPVRALLPSLVAVLASYALLDATVAVGTAAATDPAARDPAALYAASARGLATVAPYLVALTDAAGISDRELASALGVKNGDVYAAIVAMAKDEPLNATAVNPDFVRFMRPVMGSAALAKL
ncbi:acyl-CoA dehydrogenase/oxidase [Blastocladiella britannica]|nr:acyl-CoA dehydrogenase/oxidase [Blastocladiella britannica]